MIEINNIFRTSIFNRDSIEDDQFYHLSSHLENRLEISRTGALIYRRVGNTQNRPHQRWLRDIFFLAPYEADLLERMLNCESKFFVLQGGTGSGKSSCLRYIIKKAKEKSPDKWLSTHDLNNFISRVDLNDVSFNIDNKKADILQSRDVFYDEIATKLFNSITQIIDDDRNKQCLKIGKHVISELSGHEVIDTHARKLRNLLDVDNSVNYEDLDAEDVGVTIYDKIDAANGVNKFNLSLSLAIVVSTWMPGSREMLICFDNSDRLQVDFLDDLLNRFLFFLDNEFRKYGQLKIIFYVRMSTLKDQADAFDDLIVKSSSTVSPIQAVFARIVAYLFSNERLMKYDSDSASAKIIDTRLFELLTRLTEFNSSQRTIIESSSGSNIRRAFAIVTEWLSDPNPISSRYQTHEMRRHLPADIRIFFSKLALRDFVTLWMEELVLIVTEQDSTERLDLLEQHYTLLANDLSPLFDSKSKIGFKGLLSKVELNESEIKQISDYFREFYTKGNLIVVRTTKRRDKTGTVKERVIRIVNSISREASTWLESYENKPDISRLCNVAEYIETDDLTNIPNQEFYLNWRRTQDNIYYKKASQNRFEATWNLLESTMDSDTSKHVHNMFSFDGESIELTSLWILALMNAKINPQINHGTNHTSWLEGSTIIARLRNLDISREEVRKSLEILSSRQYRLVFSSTYDQDHFKEDDWDRQYYCLTWSGKLYYENMILNLHFIEWCIWATKSFFHKRVGGRSSAEVKEWMRSSRDSYDYNPYESKETDATNLRKAVRAVRHLTLKIEKQNVDYCFSEKNVLPTVDGGTPMIRCFIDTIYKVLSLFPKNIRDDSEWVNLRNEINNCYIEMVEYVRDIETNANVILVNADSKLKKIKEQLDA